MVSVLSLVEKIRIRLRDNDVEEYRYKEAEILDALNNAYCDLNFLFKLNVNKYQKEIKPDDNILRTKKMVLSVERAYLNGTPLTLKPYDEKAKSTQISSFSDFQGFIVLPKASAQGLLELFVNESVLFDKDGFINGGDFLQNALIFNALISILQIETNEANLQRVGFYESLYKKEVSRLTALIASTKEERSFQTYFNY